jgi:hypothetical protein
MTTTQTTTQPATAPHEMTPRGVIVVRHPDNNRPVLYGPATLLTRKGAVVRALRLNGDEVADFVIYDLGKIQQIGGTGYRYAAIDWVPTKAIRGDHDRTPTKVITVPWGDENALYGPVELLPKVGSVHAVDVDGVERFFVLGACGPQRTVDGQEYRYALVDWETTHAARRPWWEHEVGTSWGDWDTETQKLIKQASDRIPHHRATRSQVALWWGPCQAYLEELITMERLVEITGWGTSGIQQTA